MGDEKRGGREREERRKTRKRGKQQREKDSTYFSTTPPMFPISMSQVLPKVSLVPRPIWPQLYPITMALVLHVLPSVLQPRRPPEHSVTTLFTSCEISSVHGTTLKLNRLCKRFQATATKRRSGKGRHFGNLVSCATPQTLARKTCNYQLEESERLVNLTTLEDSPVYNSLKRHFQNYF